MDRRRAVQLLVLLAGASLLTSALAADSYVIGDQGQDCATTCGRRGQFCNPDVNTNNSDSIFKQLGINCNSDSTPWWAPDQPSYCSDPSDENYGRCVGYVNPPVNGSCQARYWSVRRLCRCTGDATTLPFFGTGYSSGSLTVNETNHFEHVVADGHFGVMTHFWVTGTAELMDNTIIRYYIDNETKPSIEFRPSMAVGVGFNDSKAPWGTKWIGMGAGNGQGKNFNVNFKIPFQKSIRVTAQSSLNDSNGFYMIVRGVLDQEITFGGVTIPKTARLQLQRQENLVLQPMDFLNVVNVPSGAGLMLMSTLQVQSGNLNFLEGCYHAYTPVDMPWPGIVLSTGTEDYFDSAWYFNAGEFRLPVAGFTHLNVKNSSIEWSAYRFHEMDPLPFNNGFRLQWRNGDMNDPHSGLKCYTLANGNIVGSPTPSIVTSYGWVYTW